MEESSTPRNDGRSVRVSHSPRRSTQIVAGLKSPVMSVHPSTHAMESINSQADFGLRTTDFFEDSSEDGSMHEVSPLDAGPIGGFFDQDITTAKRRQNTQPHQDEFVSTEIQDMDGYLSLLPETDVQPDFVDTPSSSFNGSVEELLPAASRSSPLQVPKPAHMSSARKQRNSSVMEQPTPISSVKANKILGAHAIAHEITLQALIRNEEALDRSIQSFAPLTAGDRGSVLLNPSIRVNDPRSPRRERASSPLPPTKKVHVLPPPIDTSSTRRSLPSNMTRTPYPFTPQSGNQSDFESARQSYVTGPAQQARSGILTLSVRCRNANSIPRIKNMVLPPMHNYTASRASNEAGIEQRLKGIEFDDEKFFQELKTGYGQMTGWKIRLSARRLTRIVVCGPASQAADADYGWLQLDTTGNLSPRREANSMTNPFNETNLMNHYKKPQLGHSRHAYVRWAHEIASASLGLEDEFKSLVIPISNERRLEGLEFVIGWSIKRILTALCIVIALSIAAVLLWTFLGVIRGPAVQGAASAGFRDAGERVGTALVMGICILGVGLSAIGGWIGASWLVI